MADAPLNPGRMELVADGLSFPTSVTFDVEGMAYVGESGLPFGGAPPGGRVWRVTGAGGREVVAEGLRAPLNGLAFHDGGLFASEGGHPGRITRIALDGGRDGRGRYRLDVVLDHLPGPGNYHTNMVAFGPDGKMYFSQGAMTNTGIVGLDAYELGWLRRLPHAHDVPGLDVALAGQTVETPDPTCGDKDALARTGAFAPFGVTHDASQRLPARLPFTAGVMRCDPDGRRLEAVAWGLRNAYGLLFLPDGRLLATDQGPDDRGSRPVGNAPDLLFEVRSGAWYGWPDFVGGDPIDAPCYRPARGPPPQFLLANHAELPPPQRPLMRFPPNAAAVKFDVAPDGGGTWSPRGWAGHLFVALFGDEKPMTAPKGPPAGRALARIDTSDWTLHALTGPPLARPIDVRFRPTDGALHVLDFGGFEMAAGGKCEAAAGSGRLWRIRT
jgi:glucose/arabinose dehydrogenase